MFGVYINSNIPTVLNTIERNKGADLAHSKGQGSVSLPLSSLPNWNSAQVQLLQRILLDEFMYTLQSLKRTTFIAQSFLTSFLASQHPDSPLGVSQL